MSQLNYVINEVIPPDFASKIKRIWVNQLIPIPSDIHEKTRGFLMISGVTEVN